MNKSLLFFNNGKYAESNPLFRKNKKVKIMSVKSKNNEKYKCIDCGNDLKDFNIKIITKNPDDQEFCDNTERLFYDVNGNRRFFCPICNLGYDEDEVLLASGRPVSGMNKHDKYITYIGTLIKQSKETLKRRMAKQDYEASLTEVGRINGYESALSIYLRIEGGRL